MESNDAAKMENSKKHIVILYCITSIAAITAGISLGVARQCISREKAVCSSVEPKINYMREQLGLPARKLTNYEDLADSFFGSFSVLYGGRVPKDPK